MTHFARTPSARSHVERKVIEGTAPVELLYGGGGAVFKHLGGSTAHLDAAM